MFNNIQPTYMFTRDENFNIIKVKKSKIKTIRLLIINKLTNIFNLDLLFTLLMLSMIVCLSIALPYAIGKEIESNTIIDLYNQGYQFNSNSY